MSLLQFFRRQVKARVRVQRGVLKVMVREAGQHFPAETGGLLMGYRSVDEGEPVVVITNTIGAGPRAEHSEFHFEPDDVWQVRQVAKLYASSGRLITYLGDWHSHPSGGARPSRRDVRVARLIAESPEARAPEPLISILPLDEPGAASLPTIYMLRGGKLSACAVEYP